MKQVFTKNEEAFCNLVGIIGITLSAICLVQSIIMFAVPLTSFIISCIFSYCIVSSIFLVLKRTYAPICMMVAGIICILYQLFLIYLIFRYSAIVFSLMLLLLILFYIIVLPIMYVNGLPSKLKANQLAKSSEDDYWAGKI